MSRVIAAGVGLLLGGLAGVSSYQYMHPPQAVDSSLGCVETVITQSTAPTGSSMAQGGGISFRDDIAPGNGAKDVQILGVYLPPDTYPVGKLGDHVRVCLLSVPTKSEGCDPSVDVRGREFLVYDRANQNAQVYSNGEHYCGGA